MVCPFNVPQPSRSDIPSESVTLRDEHFKEAKFLSWCVDFVTLASPFVSYPLRERDLTTSQYKFAETPRTALAFALPPCRRIHSQVKHPGNKVSRCLSHLTLPDALLRPLPCYEAKRHLVYSLFSCSTRISNWL